MLSQKAKYALRALLVLAEHAAEPAPMPISEIADREQISRKFLEAILVELRDSGLLESQRGRHGGYRLARPPGAISFAEVIRAIDGPLAPISCASRTQFRPCDDCRDVSTCAIRWAMLKARDALADALDDCSLADALRQKGRKIADRGLAEKASASRRSRS
jgi:Rrf2 family protein